MTDTEFEKLWQEKRENILLHNDEYQQIKRGYTGWNFIDYLLMIGGFLIFENYIGTFQLHVALKYILSMLGTVVLWLIYRLIKARFSGNRTLEEIENEIKERYRNMQK